MTIFFYRLVCPRCNNSEFLSRFDAQRRLQAYKKLRAAAETDESILGELVPALLPQLPCQNCGHTPLEVTVHTDKGDWSDRRCCIACGKPIPVARLAMVPEAEMCTPCQMAVERGETPGPPVYCRRCGNRMKLAPRLIGGQTRYVWVCSNAPACSYWTDRSA